MADNTNPIQYSDLVKPDDSIENLIKQLGQLIVTYEHLQEVVQKDANGMVAALLKVSGATKKGREEITQQSKEADKLAKAQEQLDFAYSNTAKEIARLNILKQRQNQINKDEAKLKMAQAGSYNALSARYNKLKQDVDNTNAVTDKGRRIWELKQHAAKRLMERMNELQKATGKYVLQVGNYNIAGESMVKILRQGKNALIQMENAGKANTKEYQQLANELAKLKDQWQDTDAMINKMASDTSTLDAIMQGMAVGTGGFAAVTGAMELFGGESKEVEEAQRKLQAAIALVNGVTAIQNALQKQSALVTKLKQLQTFILSKVTKENTATTVANTTAVTAQKVATEGATKATKGFGKALQAIKSNPIILAISLVAAAIAGTVAAVKYFRGEQRRLYEQQLKNLEVTEAIKNANNLAGNKAIADAQQRLKLAQAEGKSDEEIMKLKEEDFKLRQEQAVANSSWNKKELQDLEANKRKKAKNEKLLLQDANKEIELRKYKKDEIKAENELLDRQIEIGEKQLEINKELEVEAKALAEERRQLAIATAKADEDSLRTLQDARYSLIKNQFKRERTITKANYDRQIADIQTRLDTEVNLTEKQRNNMKDLMVALAKVQKAEIEKINQQERAANLEAERQTEQLRLALMDEGIAKERKALEDGYKKETEDLRIKLETDNDLTAKQKEEINKQLLIMQEQYLKDVEKLNDKARNDELTAELNAIALRKAALTGRERLTTEDLMREVEIRREQELIANKSLAVELRQDESLINAKYDAERKKTIDNERKEIAMSVLEIEQNLANSEIDLMRVSENKKNAERLKLEKKALEEKLRLNAEANIKMTDEEVKTIENKIKKLEEDIRKNEAPQDIYDLLGLKMTDDQKSDFDEALQYAKDALTSFYDYKLQLAQRAIEQANNEVEAAQNTLNLEKQARAEGYANNVEMAEKELNAARAQQRKALKQEQDAQRAKQRIDTLEQATNMVTASTKIYKDFGMPYAIPIIALMWGSFLATKIRARQLTASEQYGEGTVELLEGGSHQSGNDIDLGRKKDGTRRRAEGGEFLVVINKRNSRRYRKEIPQVIKSLNDGTFATKYMHTYEAAEAQIVPIFEGRAQLDAIARDMHEINERGKSNVVYTADGWVERKGNITRIVKR